MVAFVVCRASISQRHCGQLFGSYHTECWWFELWRVAQRAAIALLALDPAAMLSTGTRAFAIVLLLLLGLVMQWRLLPAAGRPIVDTDTAGTGEDAAAPVVHTRASAPALSPKLKTSAQ